MSRMVVYYVEDHMPQMKMISIDRHLLEDAIRTIESNG